MTNTPPLLSPPQPSQSRTSKLAVAGFCLSIVGLLLTIIPGVILAGFMAVPVAGLLLVVILLSPLAVICLGIQSLAWALASTSRWKMTQDPRLGGGGLATFTKTLAGFHAFFCVIQLVVYFAIPTALLYTEAVAWRHMVNRGVVTAENAVAEATRMRIGIEEQMTRLNASLGKLSDSSLVVVTEIQGLRDGTFKVSGSLDGFTTESEAWRMESQAWMVRVDRILDLDLWRWVNEVVARSWGSFTQGGDPSGTAEGLLEQAAQSQQSTRQQN